MKQSDTIFLEQETQMNGGWISSSSVGRQETHLHCEHHEGKECMSERLKYQALDEGREGFLVVHIDVFVVGIYPGERDPRNEIFREAVHVFMGPTLLSHSTTLEEALLPEQ